MKLHIWIFLLIGLSLTDLINAKLSHKNISFKSLVMDHLIRPQKQITAIMFHNENCQTCDVFEDQLQLIHRNFVESGIPMLRCDISMNKELSDKFQIKRFPIVHFIYRKPGLYQEDMSQVEIYKTTQVLAESNILDTAKYLRKTLQFLQNKNIDSFLFIQTLQQIPKGDKIVVNFESISEFYSFNQQDFFQKLMLDQTFNAMHIVPLSRELFNFYIVANNLESAIKTAKTQIILFLILEQEQGRFPIVKSFEKQQFDKLLSYNLDVLSVFKSFLFHSAQQFTQNLYIFQQEFYSFQNPSIPIYLVVIDSIWKRSQSRQHIMMLNRVLNIFDNEILIFWIQAQINPEKKLLLGFMKNAKPPMFGKLILEKNKHKQPLISKISNEPIFTQNDIKVKIRTDLGYEKLLPQRINISIQELGMRDIELAYKVDASKNVQQIQFVYCTSKYISKAYLNELSFTIKRFKKFYRDSNMKILTQPCFIHAKPVEDGLYIASRNQHNLISTTINSCSEIEPKIQQISTTYAKSFQKKKLVPQNFCIPERQMKDFLSKFNK